MNKNLNLVEILKDCPSGTKLYSTIFGEVEFEYIENDSSHPIIVKTSYGCIYGFTKSDELHVIYDGECTLFPSIEQRNWSNFKPKQPKFDPKTLKAFDKVLARMSNESYNTWYADFVAESGYTENETPLTIGTKEANMVIPYNEDTKHLVGTNEEAPEYYRYWED